MTKYDGQCLRGAGPGEAGDCSQPRQEGFCLCSECLDFALKYGEKAPPLLMTYDYVAIGRKTFLMELSDKETKENTNEQTRPSRNILLEAILRAIRHFVAKLTRNTQ